MENMKWWNDKNIDLVEIDSKIYALNGWNGESWMECWQCTGEYNMDAEGNYVIVPIYDKNNNIVRYETVG